MSQPDGKRRGTVPLTEARARLFPLVDDLLAGRTDRVALSRRGAEQDVVLMRARDVERMEAELATFRRRAAPEPRPLRGMGRIVGTATVEEVVADVRREEREGFEAKLRDIVHQPPGALRPAQARAVPAAGPTLRDAPSRRPGRR